ncbi:MAG: hypothetical protein AABZ61_08740 [Bacteroidota bacterium]
MGSCTLQIKDWIEKDNGGKLGKDEAGIKRKGVAVARGVTKCEKKSSSVFETRP